MCRILNDFRFVDATGAEQKSSQAESMFVRKNGGRLDSVALQLN